MKIVWLSHAEEQWQKAMDYCEDNFGTNVADRFQDEVVKTTELLSKYPGMGLIEVELESCAHMYRSITLNHGNYKIIYRVDTGKDTIYIVSLWNCHQNPVRLYTETDNDFPPSAVNEPIAGYGRHKAE